MSREAWGVALILSAVVPFAAVPALAQDSAAAVPPGNASENNQQEAAAIRETARKYVQLFYVADLDAVHGNFTEELKESLDLEKLKTMHRSVEDKLGKEVTLVDEIVEARDVYVLYLRRAKYEKYSGTIDGRWVFRDGMIAGLEFRPSPTP